MVFFEEIHIQFKRTRNILSFAMIYQSVEYAPNIDISAAHKREKLPRLQQVHFIFNVPVVTLKELFFISQTALLDRKETNVHIFQNHGS